jgi:hypothetical protein
MGFPTGPRLIGGAGPPHGAPVMRRAGPTRARGVEFMQESVCVFAAIHGVSHEVLEPTAGMEGFSKVYRPGSYHHRKMSACAV